MPGAWPTRRSTGFANAVGSSGTRCASRGWTDWQKVRLDAAFTHRDENVEVNVVWYAAQQLRDAYHHPDLTVGRKLAEVVLDSFPSWPIPKIARLRRTLTQWRDAQPAYLTASQPSAGGTEAVNELVEPACRVDRSFSNYDSDGSDKNRTW